MDKIYRAVLPMDKWCSLDRNIYKNKKSALKRVAALNEERVSLDSKWKLAVAKDWYPIEEE